jgi:hypothetical protein
VIAWFAAPKIAVTEFFLDPAAAARYRPAGGGR